MTSTLQKRPIIKTVHPKMTFEERLRKFKIREKVIMMRAIDGKIWRYGIYGESLTSPVYYGSCIITNISYDRSIDRNIYTIEDINSEETYTVNESYLRLWEE